MIEHLLKEINICLSNNCYMAALSLALILPDICGKAEYVNIKPNERYIKWYKVKGTEDFVVKQKSNRTWRKPCFLLGTESIFLVKTFYMGTKLWQ